MNVYDFDKTIYDGDSTVDFYFYCIRKCPRVLKKLPYQLVGFSLYAFKAIDKTHMKERFYTFLQEIDDVDGMVDDFWKGHNSGIKEWYLKHRRDDDVIISASPEFLLERECKSLGVGKMMASRVDKKTGKYDGINCHGKEKVVRFKIAFPEGIVDEFYSDSESDRPMAEIAKEAFKVRGRNVSRWEA